MAEILQPYSNFDPKDLGNQLHSIVSNSAETLQTRGLYGVIRRYGASRKQAELKVVKGQKDHADFNIEHYAVLDDTDKVAGAASIYPDLPLRRLNLPLPPAMARGAMAYTYGPQVSPNIAAWLCDDDTELLTSAYASLRRIVRQGREKPNVGTTWTTEPVASPEYIHQSIIGSGMVEYDTARYDEQEGNWRIPARSIMYIDMHSTD